MVKSVSANSSQCQLLVAADQLFFPFLVLGSGTFTKEHLSPSFRQMRGVQRNSLPASVDFHLPSAQDNLYNKLAYFGRHILYLVSRKMNIYCLTVRLTGENNSRLDLI